MMGREVSTVAIIKTELEAFRRHESELTTWEYEGTDDNGRPVTRLYPLPRVDCYTKLFTEAESRSIIAEIEIALTPAHYDQARTLARTVIGRYPKREMIDPDIFVLEMTRVFAEAPADLGQAAVDRLKALRFLPNVGDLMAALSPLVQERRRALDQARRHLAEHERRKAEAAKPKAQTYCDLTDAEKRAFNDYTDGVIRRGQRPRPISEVLAGVAEDPATATAEREQEDG